MVSYEEKRERRRRFVRQNLFWLVPLGLAAGAGVFIGVGFLVAWLWRVTLGDIFGVKAISFWQAWGLILLGQILFKANVHRHVRPKYRHRFGRAADPAGSEPGH